MVINIKRILQYQKEMRKAVENTIVENGCRECVGLVGTEHECRVPERVRAIAKVADAFCMIRKHKELAKAKAAGRKS